MSPRRIELPVEGLCDGEVRLRLAADADAGAIAAADPAIARATPIAGPAGASRARAWVGRSRGGGAGGDLRTVIADAASGEPLGAALLGGIDRSTGRCAAGYWVLPGARGRGVATRALRLLCAYAFEHLGLTRIEAWIDPGNGASARVAERVGFARRGIVRRSPDRAGAEGPMLLYSLAAGGLRPSTAATGAARLIGQ